MAFGLALPSPRAAIQRRLRAFARKRAGKDRDPVLLHKRRVYILPTGAGYVFALIVGAMLLGSMNYSNSLSFGLTFMLVSLGIVAMHHTHRQLLDLEVHTGRVHPVFVGERARFHLILQNNTAHPRTDIQIEFGDAVHQVDSVPARGQTEFHFDVDGRRRGHLRPDNFGLSSSYPLGLFRAWTWVYLPLEVLVYPEPSAALSRPPPLPDPKEGRRQPADGDEDFAGLRAYRPGDSPRHVHWKAYAREQDPQVKVFTGEGSSTVWFDLAALSGMELEPALSLMTRWVLDADHADQRYGLRTSAVEVPPGDGPAHRHRVLKELALFQSPEPDLRG
jgi:uncharacterized protein (DUF58 family)